jgi:hypothetical protein
VTHGPWADYEAAVVEMDVSGGRVRIVPCRAGIAEGSFPAPATETVHIVTAFRPSGARDLADGENRARQDELERELTARGLRWWPAWGGDAAWTHVEDSAAIVGMTEVDAFDLGRRFGQDAIFAWTAQAWTLLPCGDRRPTVMGWRISACRG